MTKFAEMLTNQAHRPVQDVTALTGSYSYALYFTPDGPNSGDSPYPGIFGAVQEQLGLPLDGRKGQVETLIVGHAEKVPTGN